jgi:hypothetical protein
MAFASPRRQRKRKLIVSLLCAGRLCLAGLLLWYGGAFLAHTLEIDELILNGTLDLTWFDTRSRSDELILN